MYETKRDWRTKLPASSLVTVSYKVPSKEIVYLTTYRTYGAPSFSRKSVILLDQSALPGIFQVHVFLAAKFWTSWRDLGNNKRIWS
jgi:hypothetical protein